MINSNLFKSSSKNKLVDKYSLKINCTFVKFKQN